MNNERNFEDDNYLNCGERKRLFTKELRCMMHGFGDHQSPDPESIDLLEDIVLDYMRAIALEAAEVRGSPKIQANDLLFILRNDDRKYDRSVELLNMYEEIKRAKKAFEDKY